MSSTFNLSTMEVADWYRLYDMLPGLHFYPTDDELIEKFLKAKVYGGSFFPPGLIHEVDVYLYHPRQLYDIYRREGEQGTYFFTRRNRKYAKGNRPDRVVVVAGRAAGFWKATGGQKGIKLRGDTIGHKQNLVYHMGSHRKRTKTNWIMHEFTLPNEMQLDDWVLCRIYERALRRSQTSDLRSWPNDENFEDGPLPVSMNPMAVYNPAGYTMRVGLSEAQIGNSSRPVETEFTREDRNIDDRLSMDRNQTSDLQSQPINDEHSQAPPLPASTNTPPPYLTYDIPAEGMWNLIPLSPFLAMPRETNFTMEDYNIDDPRETNFTMEDCNIHELPEDWNVDDLLSIEEYQTSDLQSQPNDKASQAPHQ